MESAVDDPSALLAVTIVVGGVFAAAMLVIAYALVSRRVLGLSSAEVFPHSAVPAPLVIVLLCLCIPFALIAWFPLWLFRIERSDGTSWSVRWKLAYSVSPLMPLVVAAFVLSRMGVLSGGPTFLSVLSPAGPLLLATADVVAHRRS